MMSEQASEQGVSPSGAGLSSLRDQAPAGLAHSASIPDADLTDIDPATGDFWLTGQPEYWRVAARAHRETPALSDRQREANERYARECEARAELLAARP